MAKRTLTSSNRIPGKTAEKEVLKAEGGIVPDDMDLGFDEPQSSPPQKQVEAKPFERVFSKTRKIVSDVFKLEAAPVLKQVGVATHPNVDPQDFKEFEHTHVFRTFDSDGKRHDRCCMTAGHFHDIEWEYDQNQKPVVKSVSGPKVMTRKLLRGKWIQVSTPVNDYDDHTHDISYLQSHEVQARHTNIEATKVIALEAQKGANPGGVMER